MSGYAAHRPGRERESEGTGGAIEAAIVSIDHRPPAAANAVLYVETHDKGFNNGTIRWTLQGSIEATLAYSKSCSFK